MKKYLFCMALAMAATGSWAQDAAQIHSDFVARSAEMTAAGAKEQMGEAQLAPECRKAL